MWASGLLTLLVRVGDFSERGFGGGHGIGTPQKGREKRERLVEMHSEIGEGQGLEYRRIREAAGEKRRGTDLVSNHFVFLFVS